MNQEQLLLHLLTGPGDSASGAGLKFLALDTQGRIVEIPSSYMASEPMTDYLGQFLYDDDIEAVEYLFI